MSKILVTESNLRAKEAFSALEKEGHNVVHIEGIPREHDILVNKDTEILSVFVNTAVTGKVIKGLPELKLIATRSTGIDHIGRETAQERNVCIANVPGYGTAPVAEQTFALLLSLLRKTVKADASIRAGKWEPFRFQGTNISGRTFGVIGTGAIGVNVARIAKAFGGNVIAYDVIRRADKAEEIGFSYVELDDLIRRSDIISLHVPLCKETYHLINSETMSKMKDGVIIINTARGPIIDYKALTGAIRNGKVGGAALDVYEPEPPDSSNELFKLERTVLTPHIAWNTEETEKYILDVTLNTIKEFLAGLRPKNILV